MKVKKAFGWTIRIALTSLFLIVTLACFFFGTLFLPYQFIPSNLLPDQVSRVAKNVSTYFSPPAQPAIIGAEIQIPFFSIPATFYNITQDHIIEFQQYTAYQPMELMFNLTGGDLVINQHLTLTVTMGMSASLLAAYGSPIVTVSLDNALAYPFTNYEMNLKNLNSCPPLVPACWLNLENPSFDRLIFNTSRSNNVAQMGPWSASQEIVYTVSGSFGATINVIPSLPSPSAAEFGIIQTYHTPALYTIYSQDVITNKRNALFETALALYILGVAFLDVSIEVSRHIWPKARGNQSDDENVEENWIKCFS